MPLSQLSPWSEALFSPRSSVEVNPHRWGIHHRSHGYDFRNRVLCYDLIYFVLRGETSGKASGREFVLNEGSTLLLPAGTSHDLKWLDPVDFYNCQFRLNAEDTMISCTSECHVLHQQYYLKPLVNALMGEIEIPSQDDQYSLKSLLYLIVTKVQRHSGKAPKADEWQLNLSQRQLIREYARRHAKSRPSPADLARVVGLSPDYFSRRFKATFNTSARDWLARERVREASIELEITAKSVSQVAYEFGYASPAQFSRQFVKTMGVPPSAYRA